MNHVTRPEPPAPEPPAPQDEALARQREAMRKVLDTQRATLAELAKR